MDIVLHLYNTIAVCFTNIIYLYINTSITKYSITRELGISPPQPNIFKNADQNIHIAMLRV